MYDDPDLPAAILLAFVELELRSFLKQLRDRCTQGHIGPEAYDPVAGRLLATVALAKTVHDAHPAEP